MDSICDRLEKLENLVHNLHLREQERVDAMHDEKFPGVIETAKPYKPSEDEALGSNDFYGPAVTSDNSKSDRRETAIDRHETAIEALERAAYERRKQAFELEELATRLRSVTLSATANDVLWRALVQSGVL
jgi:hypothetical protein